MSSGRLGHASVAANTDTDLYTVPANTLTTANLSLCNRSATPAAVRIAVRDGVLAFKHYLEYDTQIPGHGVLERTAIVMSAGEILTVRVNADGITARAHGFEEDV